MVPLSTLFFTFSKKMWASLAEIWYYSVGPEYSARKEGIRTKKYLIWRSKTNVFYLPSKAVGILMYSCFHVLNRNEGPAGHNTQIAGIDSLLNSCWSKGPQHTFSKLPLSPARAFTSRHVIPVRSTSAQDRSPSNAGSTWWFQSGAFPPHLNACSMSGQSTCRYPCLCAPGWSSPGAAHWISCLIPRINRKHLGHVTLQVSEP